MLEEDKKRVERGEDARWEPATKDNLLLNKPGMMVEPDVRDKIADYLKKMGLIR